MDHAHAVLESTPEAAACLPLGLAFLSVDVESNPGDGDRIFRVAAVRSDREAKVDLSIPAASREAGVRRLNDVAAGADLLVGHNLRRHDMPLLAAQLPGLDWRHLPVVDTLELSTLAFPRNPYHR